MPNGTTRHPLPATSAPWPGDREFLAACEDTILGLLARRPDESDTGATERYTLSNCLDFARRTISDFPIGFAARQYSITAADQDGRPLRCTPSAARGACTGWMWSNTGSRTAGSSPPTMVRRGRVVWHRGASRFPA